MILTNRLTGIPPLPHPFCYFSAVFVLHLQLDTQPLFMGTRESRENGVGERESIDGCTLSLAVVQPTCNVLLLDTLVDPVVICVETAPFIEKDLLNAKNLVLTKLNTVSDDDSQNQKCGAVGRGHEGDAETGQSQQR